MDVQKRRHADGKMAAVFRHIGIRHNAGILHAGKLRHFLELLEIRSPHGTGKAQPRPGDGARLDKARNAALGGHAADIADGVFRVRVRRLRRRKAPGVGKIIEKNGALRALLKRVFPIRRAGDNDRVELFEYARFPRAVNRRRRLFEKAGDIPLFLNEQGINFMAVENHGFSAPLEPQRERQQLRVVQVVQLAVERERRFKGVLHERGREPVERPDGLFPHADDVYALLLPALAGGDERDVIPGAGKRHAFFMEYPRIVAAVYAGKVTDSFHSFSDRVSAVGSANGSSVSEARMARYFRTPWIVYSTPLHTASGSGTRTKR